MKKIILFLIIILFSNTANADICEVTCPNINITENESLLNKVTGMNFISKKIIETAIEKEINEELNSKANADLKIYSVKKLKNGEFKGLKLKSEQIKYKALSLSNFEAETICQYNKVIFKKIIVKY